MGRQIKLEIIGEAGTSGLGTVQSGEARVGREPGAGGIIIDRDGISRVHGSFVRIQNHWLYRDNASTNGSWVNGRKLAAHQWAIVRSGSIVQLADVGVRVLETTDSGEQQSLRNFPGLGGRCVLVFKNGEFLAEYPVPEYGRALTVGGTGGDLELDGDLAEAPALVIERRGDTIVCYSVEKILPLYVNGEEVLETKTISDGMEVSIAEYSILYNDPGYTTPGATRMQHAATDTGTFVRGWEDADRPVNVDDSQRMSSSGVFGSESHDAGRSAFEEDDINAPGYDPGSTFTGRRTSAFNQPKQPASYASIEEKIIMGVGLCVVFAVMLLLIWWLIQ